MFFLYSASCLDDSISIASTGVIHNRKVFCFSGNYFKGTENSSN